MSALEIRPNDERFRMGERRGRPRVPLPLDEVRPTVEAALLAEGFGVLTEIDVAATMRAKLGIDGPPYVILGACNPSLAHRALQADRSVGALLPCNVLLCADGDGTIIEAMDPAAVIALADAPDVQAVAAEARERLVRVIASVTG